MFSYFLVLELILCDEKKWIRQTFGLTLVSSVWINSMLDFEIMWVSLGLSNLTTKLFRFAHNIQKA